MNKPSLITITHMHTLDLGRRSVTESYLLDVDETYAAGELSSDDLAAIRDLIDGIVAERTEQAGKEAGHEN